MHTCINCGHEFDGKFCPECGAKWVDPEACPKCGARHEPNATFCQECGARLDGKINCPKCGALMDGKASFCGECGAKLDGQAKVEKATGGTGAKLKYAFALSGVILILLSALMGLVFAFVTGITIEGEVYGVKLRDTSMLYDFFGNNYKDLKEIRTEIKDNFDWMKIGDAREFALYFPVVLGTVVSALGLLGVVALSGLTAYKAYKRFYKKEEANVIAPAAATYFTFVAMATVLLSIVSVNSDDSKTVFSAPTLAGLITGGVLLGLGVIILALTNLKEFKGFNASVGAISTIIVSMLSVVVIAIVSLPAGGMEVSSRYLGSQKGFFGLFPGMQAMLMLVEKDSAMDKIIAFATIGGVAGIALAITSAVTLVIKISALCSGKNNSSAILGAVNVVLSVIYLVFTILAFKAMIDGAYGDIEKSAITFKFPVTITIVVMAALSCAAEFTGKFVHKDGKAQITE